VRFLVILALLAASSCVPRHTGVRLYDLDLRLSLEAEDDARRVGDVVPYTFVVTNVGKLTLEACLETESRGFVFLHSGSPSGGMAQYIDHPSCLERFVLDPGEQLRWTTQVEIPVQAAGADELTAWITVVDPIGCGLYGCLSTKLEADAIPVRVLPDDRSPSDEYGNDERYP
jgi:hypothetical protein